jgi:hypothetical protein
MVEKLTDLTEAQQANDEAVLLALHSSPTFTAWEITSKPLAATLTRLSESGRVQFEMTEFPHFQVTHIDGRAV